MTIFWSAFAATMALLFLATYYIVRLAAKKIESFEREDQIIFWIIYGCSTVTNILMLLFIIGI